MLTRRLIVSHTRLSGGLALVLAMLASGCGDRITGPDIPRERNPGASESGSGSGAGGSGGSGAAGGETVVIDSAELRLVSTPTERTAGTYRFEILDDEPAPIEAGDVIVGGQADGFLRRVTQVTRTGRELAVRTDFASLADAVEQGSLSASVDLATEPPVGPGSPAEPSPTANLIGPRDGVSLSGRGIRFDNYVLFEDQVCEGGACTNVSLRIPDGRIHFAPRLDLGAEFDSGIEEFHAIATGALDFDLSLSLTASAAYKIERDAALATVEWRLPPMFIGFVPVYATARLEFVAGFKAEAKAKGTVQTGLDSRYALSVGARYDDNGWTDVFETDKRLALDATQAELEGEASVRLFVRPQLTIFLYAVAGPAIGLEPYLRGHVQVLRDVAGTVCELGLYAGADARLGFKAEILSFSLADYNKNFQIAETQLDRLDLDCENTDSVLVPYGGSGHRYSVGSFDHTRGFEQLDFDDAGWAIGDAGFGSGVGCPLDGTVRTRWPLGTDLLVRREIDLPAGARSLKIGVAIDNDVQVFVNGVDISGGLQSSENCARRDRFVFEAPDGILRNGRNVIAVRARDRGIISYFDMQVTAQVP